MKTYEILKDDFGNDCSISVVGENTIIPLDPNNSDYQAYLKRDEPQVEHLTEKPTV